MAPRYQPNCKVCGAPRSPRTDMRFCETHLREYNAAASRKSAGKGATSTTQTREERAEYMRRYREQHRDERPAQRKLRREANAATDRERSRRQYYERKAQMGADLAEERRIERNLRAARTAGLDDLDAWRAVLLAERERDLRGPSALYGGRFGQIIAEVAAMQVRALLDWQPAAGDTAVIDGGWDYEEAV